MPLWRNSQFFNRNIDVSSSLFYELIYTSSSSRATLVFISFVHQQFRVLQRVSCVSPQLEVHEAKAMLDNHPQWDIPDTEEEDEEQEDSDGIEESEDDDEDND